MRELNVDVKHLVKRMEAILQKLAEARIMSRYRRIFKGKGLEFEDFREYNEDDDASRIDWKASVRANKTLIKRYKEERDLDIYILFDVSSSMVFGSTEKLKNEYAAEFVAALSHIILFTGDKAGLFMFSDSVIKKVLPANNQDQFYVILRNLLDPNNYGGGCNLGKAIREIINFSKEKGIMVIVSDFIGLEKDWEEGIKVASAKFDVMGVMIHDPRDEVLPRNVGKVLIKDPFSKREIMVDPDEIADKYEKYALEQKLYVKRVFTQYHADFLDLRTDKDFVVPFLSILKRREAELA